MGLELRVAFPVEKEFIIHGPEYSKANQTSQSQCLGDGDYLSNQCPDEVLQTHIAMTVWKGLGQLP